MRRLLLIGITFAVLLGGSSSALSAMLCPHAGNAAASGVHRAPEHAGAHETLECCRREQPPSSTAGETPHCPMSGEGAASASEHGERRDGATETAPANNSTDSTGATRASNVAEVLEPFATPCGHCMSRSERLPSPVAVVREPESARRDAGAFAARILRRLCAPPAASFNPANAPARGAPPGETPRHILNSVFLI